MRITAEATCLSWIPPEAVEGTTKLPFGLGVAHYDAPPPDSSRDVDALLAADAIRFANQLRAWIEVDGDCVTSYGTAGGGRLGSTTLRLGSRGVTFAGVAQPDITGSPELQPGQVRFTQTAGGHTGVAVPRAVPHPPYWRLSSPLAWSTIALILRFDGSSDAEITDTSVFPRHYLYDSTGQLTHKSAVIRYKDWFRRSEQQQSPWGGQHDPVPVARVKAETERSLADSILVSRDFRQHHLQAGAMLSELPIELDEVHLLLDGLLFIEIDDRPATEVGPGAIFDPTMRTPESKEHVTVRAQTPCRLAVVPRDQLDSDKLLGVAAEQTARLSAARDPQKHRDRK